MKQHKDGTAPLNGEVFVFGSNLSGIHGAGAAAKAHKDFGAIWGVGSGHHGQSYAIPTKDFDVATRLPISRIRMFVDEFNEYVALNPTKEFFLTRVGCALAGYKDEDIAPLFKFFPNVSYPESWANLIQR